LNSVILDHDLEQHEMGWLRDLLHCL
jgi:hypothetical protein